MFTRLFALNAIKYVPKNLSQSIMFTLQLKCHYLPILLCHCVFTIKNPFNYFDFPIECSERSGAASGTCAAGFGVCCVFLTSSCGSTVKENCTYIRYLRFNNVISVVEFNFRIIVIHSELLSFVILNSSCTLPYPKGEKIGQQSRPYLRVELSSQKIN